MKPVIFTDLDGTLLDSSYSFEAALPVIRRVREEGIPLVPVTSKTRAEVERLMGRLGVRGPFITENGGGIFIPDGTFPFPVGGEDAGGLSLIRLGTPYEALKAAFREIREKTGFRMTGFSDLTPEGISERTGLSPEEARLALLRDFDEPFFLESGSLGEIRRLAGERALTVTAGKVLHLTGKNDKGLAVRTLRPFYDKLYGKAVTIGLGDRGNDVPMLRSVDYPVLVRREDGLYEEAVGVPGLIFADGVGPAGWAKALTGILDSIKGSQGSIC